MLNNMKIENLNFGNIEGKNEFKGKKIEDLYLDIFNADKVIKEKKYYIYGNKGTGKTSLLRYLEYKVSQEKKKTLIILFKDIKKNISIYSKFKKLINESLDHDMATQAFWQWLLLSIIVQENKIDVDEKKLIFNAKDKFFKKISNLFMAITQGLKGKYNQDGIEVELDASKIKLEDNNDSLEEAGENIDYLSALVNSNLKNGYYIFIDELETSSITSTNREDSILIKNLINSISFLNSVHKNLHIVVAVRTEILDNIYTIGDEINKLLESEGIEIKWIYDKYNIQHPLIKMIIKKMRLSMIEYSPNDEQKIRMENENNIFKRWFPEQLLSELNSKKGDNAKIILHNTWLKPRDLVRFMNIMKEKAKMHTSFKRKHYDDAVKEYSQKAWIEIKEELSANLEPDKIESLEECLSNFKTRFFYSELQNRLKTKINEDTEKIILLLFKIGVIGNNYKQGKNFVFKYYYRGDKHLDKDNEIEIHRGLWKAFSLKVIRGTQIQPEVEMVNSALHEQLQSLNIR